MQVITHQGEDSNATLLLVEETRLLHTVNANESSELVPDRLCLGVGDLVSSCLAEFPLLVDLTHRVTGEKDVNLSFLTLDVLVDNKLIMCVLLHDHEEGPNIFGTHCVFTLTNGKDFTCG